MSHFRAGLILASYVALSLPLMLIQQFLVWFWPERARVFPMIYTRQVLWLLGVRVQLKGHAIAKGPAILAPNHVSWLDVVILSSVAPVSFIAKREVGAWPFFGAQARLIRTVFVDRERRQGTASTREEMVQRLAAGDTLVLFAEGTSGDGASVMPFKTALFAAAQEPNIVVQPISLVYKGHRNLPMTRRLRPHYAWYGGMDLGPHLWKAVAMGPIEIDVICHKPISGSDIANRKLLARQVEDTVRQGLVQSLHGR